MSGSGGISGAALPAALFGGASAVFYGVDTILGKRLLLEFSPAEVLSYHSFVAALALLPLTSGGPPPLHLLLWRPLAGAVFIGYGCGALYLAGLRRVPAQRGAVLTYLEPLVASAVGALAFHESLSPLSIAGGFLILAGGAAIVLETVREPDGLALSSRNVRLSAADRARALAGGFTHVLLDVWLTRCEALAVIKRLRADFTGMVNAHNCGGVFLFI